MLTCILRVFEKNVKPTNKIIITMFTVVKLIIKLFNTHIIFFNFYKQIQCKNVIVYAL